MIYVLSVYAGLADVLLRRHGSPGLGPPDSSSRLRAKQTSSGTRRGDWGSQHFALHLRGYVGTAAVKKWRQSVYKCISLCRTGVAAFCLTVNKYRRIVRPPLCFFDLVSLSLSLPLSLSLSLNRDPVFFPSVRSIYSPPRVCRCV